MNLLQLLNDYAATNIDLNDVTPDDAHSIFRYRKPFEFLDEHNIKLTRELTEHERNVIETKKYIQRRLFKNIAVLENQTITPETLYAIIKFIDLRHGYETSAKINAYFKRTLTTDTFALSVLYRLTNDTHYEMRLYNAILTAMNIIEMPINEIVNHILNDNLVETVDLIISDKNYKRMSDAKTVQLLMKYIYDFDMTQNQFKHIQNAESTNYHLLSMIFNKQKINPDKLNDFFNIHAPRVKHLEIIA